MSAPPRLRASAGLAAGGLVAGVALVACQVIAGLELPRFVDLDGATGDATTPEAGASLPLECDPRVPPNPRRGTGTGPDLHFAIEFLDFGFDYDAGTGIVRETGRLCVGRLDSGAELDPAVDLDGVQTCAPLADGGAQGGSCRAPREEACDPAGGGDNMGLGIASLAFGDQPNAASDPNRVARDGRANLMLRVSNYNGQEDDAEVSVGLVQVLGLAAGGKLAPADAGLHPAFDGTDEWVADERSIPSEQQPVVRTDLAYVASGVLVARFKNASVSFGGSGSDLQADEVVVTGRVVRDAAGQVKRLDRGRIAARLPKETLWRYATGRSLSGDTVCSSAVTRKFALDLVCGSLDLPSGASSFAPEAPCEAVSFAAGFYASRANLAADRAKGPDAAPPYTCDAGALSWPPKSCDDF